MNAALVLCLLAFAGSVVFALVISGWRQRLGRAFEDRTELRPSADPPMISLVIPVRDGARTIDMLLQDLHAQLYPKDRSEVIVVDDHSGDGTADVVRGMMRSWPQLRLLNNEGEGKKAAIARGAKEANGQLIILTDADARCGPERLARIAASWLASNADMLLAPVRTNSNGSLLGRIQANEQAALIVVAAASAIDGSPVLANGANMAFTKAAFQTVGGYHGDRYASGDDIFLLHRMRKAGKRITYVIDQEAAVHVEAENTFSGFVQQRLRWAGKMRGVSGGAKWMGALGLLFPFFLLAVTCVINWRVGQGLLRSSLLLSVAWLLWLVPVLGLVREGKRFLGQQHSTGMALVSFIAFTIYAPLIAVVSLFVRPSWKGRWI